MLKLFLCLKYLKAKKIVAISIVAVALCFAMLAVVASLFTGFIGAIETAAADNLGDIVFTPPVRFDRHEEFSARLEENPHIKAASAILYSDGLLYLGKGNVRAVSIWGIDPAKRCEVTGLKGFLLGQKDSSSAAIFQNERSAFVGLGVIAEPNAQTDKYDLTEAEAFVGKNVVLTTGTVMNAGSGGEQQRMRPKKTSLTISDIIFSGVYRVDESVVCIEIEQLTKMLYPGSAGTYADVIHIKCSDGTDPEAVIDEVSAIWDEFAKTELGYNKIFADEREIVTALQMQSGNTRELKKQMGMLLLIFGVISCGVILLIFCVFYMIVMTRLKDIAIVKAIGASGLSTASIFILYGTCVGIAGSALGLVLGYFVTINVDTIENYLRIFLGLKLWDSSVYMFSKVPNQFDWFYAGQIFIAASVASALGALVPAIIATRTRPARLLQYE